MPRKYLSLAEARALFNELPSDDESENSDLDENGVGTFRYNIILVNDVDTSKKCETKIPVKMPRKYLSLAEARALFNELSSDDESENSDLDENGGDTFRYNFILVSDVGTSNKCETKILHKDVSRTAKESIAVSNFSSGPGSIDSCQYSSNGSDSNSGSSPCSPEESDRCSRAGSPHSMPPTSPANHYCSESEDQLSQTDQNFRIDSNKLNGSSVFEENGNNFLFNQTQSGPADCDNVQLNNSNSENIKHFYLQDSSCSVPNSRYEPFQNFKSSPSAAQAAKSSEVQSLDKTAELCKSVGHSNIMHQTDSKHDFSSSNTSTNQSNCSSTDMQQCSWVHCNTYLEGNTELVEHIRAQHVLVQKEKESFSCLWVGCKVYNRSSCSLSWLERHILTHGGSKPFKCIVDNCNQRFPTQSALQRHVNSHFDSHPNNHNGKMGRYRDETSSKSFRRKKHRKYKKTSMIGKTAEDFFDTNIMEQIRYKLVEIHSEKPLGSTNNPSEFITLHSRVKAIRTDKSGEVKVLLQWMPENILPDCWVSEKSALRCKKVPFSSLPQDVLVSLNLQLKDECDDSPRVKQRRK